jgi:hypothetical protein
MYAPVGWGRRQHGSNTFQETRRHLRDPNHGTDGARTLCGIPIPERALRRPPTGAFFATIVALGEPELARHDACVRCYRTAGRPIVSAAGRAEIAAKVGGDRRAFADALFEIEGLR